MSDFDIDKICPDKDGYCFFVPSREAWLNIGQVLLDNGYGLTIAKDDIYFCEVIVE